MSLIKVNRLHLYIVCFAFLTFCCTTIAICQTKALDTDKIESELAAKRDLFAQEEENELNSAASDTQSMIDNTQKRADSDVAEVPQFFYDARGRRVNNPDYNSAVESIQTDAQSRIKDINARLSKQQEMIRQKYQQKIDGLAGSILNINSQLAPTTKGVQLIPAGSDLYVRNYSYGEKSSGKKQENNGNSSKLQ